MNSRISPETQRTIEKVDFSVRPEIIKRARFLLGNRATPESSARWIHSRTKKVLEGYLIGAFGSVLTAPLAVVSIGSVIIADGLPIFYHLPVAFLGKDFEVVSEADSEKLRSLRKDVNKNPREHFTATAFTGGKNRPESNADPRAHRTGVFLRRTALDEIPQVWKMLSGSMTLVGPRGYTLEERDDLTIIFRYYADRFPQEVHRLYLTTMSEIRPTPGLLGLYSATNRKDLTISERTLLDLLQTRGSSLVGDVAISFAAAHVLKQGTGGR